MNKETYLKQLEALLKKHLSKAEVEDILRDYGEFFEDGRRQGKTDTEIAAKLGSPELIAEQFTVEGSGGSPEEAKEFHDRTSAGFTAVAEGMEKTAGLLGQGLKNLWSGLCRMVRWLWKLCGRILKAAGKAVLWFSFILALGFVGLAAILLVLFGLALLVASVATFSLLPASASLCGMFGGLFMLCFSALAGILAYRMARRGWQTAEQAYFPKKEAA